MNYRLFFCDAKKDNFFLQHVDEKNTGFEKKRNKFILRFLRSIFGLKEELFPPSVLITGGGTGGHLFPGIAIAESLIEKDNNTRILFVSTGNAFEKAILSKKGFSLETIDVEGIKGRGVMAKLKSLFKIPKAFMASIAILKEFQPGIVIGMGGYSSGPVALAAWVMGIRIVLHEQNIRPGITNRLLSRIADRIYVSFHGTKMILNPEKLRIFGNPVRKEILESAGSLGEYENQLNQTSEKKMTIVVLGGSQGAHSINMAVIEALPYLAPGRNYHFIHQTGVADEATVAEAYKRWTVPGVVQPFFHDMAALYSQADLLICRAGATTVAEVTSIGKSVIFIPYPFAADNHQVLNAKALVDEGAAEMIKEDVLSGKKLAERINALEDDPVHMNEMKRNSKKLGHPDAAEEIIKDIYNLIKGV
jgi:UDP-N-acetylglucosamine--N-acetylmuramyl-(pentapeptide) pyrophosphoryl-undecaprenol N-acetylglucosamine transferase